MALFDFEVTAREVFDLVSLPPSKFVIGDEGKTAQERSEVQRHIMTSILPDLARSAEIEADDAAAPLDFPLSDATIAARWGWDANDPNDALLIQQRQERQAAPWRLAVKYEAASELLMSAKTSGSDADEIRQRAIWYADKAEKARAKAIQSTADIVAHTTPGGDEQITEYPRSQSARVVSVF